MRDPLKNVEERVGYFRTTRDLTLPVPSRRRGLGPTGAVGTTGTACGSLSGCLAGDVRNVPAEARSTVRPALAASSSNSFRAVASAATSTGTFVAPLSIRTTVAIPIFLFQEPSAKTAVIFFRTNNWVGVELIILDSYDLFE